MKQLVEPIRSKEKLAEVEKYLKSKSKRNHLLFVLGINSGLRISDILALDVKDVRNKTHIEIIEIKTKKRKKFFINQKLKPLITDFIKDKEDDEPLFLSQKGYRLDSSQVYRMINDACNHVGITVNVGTHTMRKSFGYHHYRKFKDVATLMTIFNHSNPQITLRYIGISQDELDKSYKNFIL